MNEKQYDSLRQQDLGLREALSQEAAELPPMPADLNERLMERIGRQQSRPVAMRRLWPWIAAACVAATMVVLLMPPKTPTPIPAAKGNSMATPDVPKVEEPVTAQVETTIAKPKERSVKVRKARARVSVKPADTVLTAQETITTTDVPAAETPQAALAQAEPEEKPVTLTERDIPITRPENYHYTPEEIALMKRQANEAYLKWMQLELEIMKYNQEQTAQQ